MKKINFYHLINKDFINVLPSLLNNSLKQDFFGDLIVDDEKTAIEIHDFFLNNLNKGFFLPVFLDQKLNYLLKQDNSDLQTKIQKEIASNTNNSKYFSIKLNEKIEKINNEVFFINTFPKEDFIYNNFSAIIFRNNDEKKLNEARKLWKNLKEKKYNISYFKEKNNGWEKLR